MLPRQPGAPVQSQRESADGAWFGSWLKNPTLSQYIAGQVQRRQGATFGKLRMLDQARQLAQAGLVDAHRLRFIAGQAFFIEIRGQHYLNLLAHITRRQAQLGQQLQLMRTEAGFFLQLTVGRHQHVLTRFDQPFGQRQLIVIGAAAVFLDQQGVLVIDHRHNHHRTIAGTLTHQPLVGALHAVAEKQLQLLNAEQAAAGDDFASEYGGFLTHGAAPGQDIAGYHSAAFPIICVGDCAITTPTAQIATACASTRRTAHACLALERHRYRPAGYGRPPARPALRQPLLAAAPAAALCRAAWRQPRAGRGRAAAAVSRARRHAQLVLHGFLEPRAEPVDPRPQARGGTPDRPAPGRRHLYSGAAPSRQTGGADHQRAPRFAIAKAGTYRAGALLRPTDQLPRLWLSQGRPAVLARPAAGHQLHSCA